MFLVVRRYKQKNKVKEKIRKCQHQSKLLRSILAMMSDAAENACVASGNGSSGARDQWIVSLQSTCRLSSGASSLLSLFSCGCSSNNTFRTKSSRTSPLNGGKYFATASSTPASPSLLPSTWRTKRSLTLPCACAISMSRRIEMISSSQSIQMHTRIFNQSK